jgi:hypothetical protein
MKEGEVEISRDERGNRNRVDAVEMLCILYDAFAAVVDLQTCHSPKESSIKIPTTHV